MGHPQRVRVVILVAFLAAVSAACGDGAGPVRAPRSFLMGFSDFPPRLDSTIVIPALNYWIPHADAAIMHVSPPWAALIGGVSPAAAEVDVRGPLAHYYRAKAPALLFTVDSTPGLNPPPHAPQPLAPRPLTPPP